LDHGGKEPRVEEHGEEHGGRPREVSRRRLKPGTKAIYIVVRDMYVVVRDMYIVGDASNPKNTTDTAVVRMMASPVANPFSQTAKKKEVPR